MRKLAIAPLRKEHDMCSKGKWFRLLAALRLLRNVLLAGLIEMTRRYAQSAERVKSVATEMRSARLLDAAFGELARADPGSLRVTASSLDASIGSEPISAMIQRASDGDVSLNWVSPSLKRSFVLPTSARFEMLQGLVVLKDSVRGSVLAIGGLRRTLPFDCQFDTVVRECRE